MSQPQLPFGPRTGTNPNQFDPVAFAREGARRYTETTGMKWSGRGLDEVQADPQRGVAQYQAYKRAQSAGTESPEIRRSYEDMRTHVNNQYDFMTRPVEKGGMGVQVEVTNEDPYHSPLELRKDLAENRRVKVLSSEVTGGHQFFTNEENDRFRAVHDVFGHAATGRGFSRHGEEAAWQSHAQMFPESARNAMTSETRGQNSYLNFGGGDFPAQSGALVEMPNWATGNKSIGVPKPRRQLPQGVQGVLGV